MFGFLIGYHTDRRSPLPRRRPGPIATAFWIFIVVIALIALFEVQPLVFGPIVGILVLLVVLGGLGQLPGFRHR